VSPLPPRIVRRVLIAPGVVLVTFFVLTTLPLWIIVAAAMSPLLTGRWRALRLLWMVLIYLGVEAVGVVYLFWLWIVSGFGASLKSRVMQEAHYALLARLLAQIDRSARRVLNVDFELQQRGQRAETLDALERPLVVLSRHAGPGDSLLLIHEVLVELKRRPRIVLKDLLQYDPVIDIALNRLPNRFIETNPGAGEDLEPAIRELAEGMEPRDALVIFPEGGNFTERRRIRAIERLRRLGFRRHADEATRMQNVMAPRPGGSIAAVAATPKVDIMFVAHTGLEQLSTLADLWRGLPMDQTVKTGWWIVREEDVPTSRQEQIDWLFREWNEVDDWIDAHRRAPEPPASPEA
jgi:1-acyl-sn-glycerol-3-phosphate acyltransferase